MERFEMSGRPRESPPPFVMDAHLVVVFAYRGRRDAMVPVVKVEEGV
jgi:hypothetical protein